MNLLADSPRVNNSRKARKGAVGDVRTFLDKELYGLHEEKEAVLSYVETCRRLGQMPERMLCLLGPNGTGKKTLLMSLAKGLGIEPLCVKIGISDPRADAQSYGKMRIGEIAGRIVHSLAANPDRELMFVLVGAEQLSFRFQEKLSYTFREVLALTHEHALRLKHISRPVDFGRALFFATASDLASMTQEAFAQFEFVPLKGYTDEEKVEIAAGWLLPRLARKTGVRVHAPEAVLYELIRRYTNELGLRDLERALRKICRYLVLQDPQREQSAFQVDTGVLGQALGRPLFHYRVVSPEGHVGVVPLVGISEGRGVVSEIESLLYPSSHPRLVFTGMMDQAFQESVVVALSVLRSRADHWGIDRSALDENVIHVNILPANAQKTGVSAGLGVFLSLLSAARSTPMPPRVSAVGEICLRGAVLPVAGIREKALAAQRLGVETLLLPRDNYEEVITGKTGPRGLTLVPVRTVDDAVREVFGAGQWDDRDAQTGQA
ncbi:S16 family serine protease [Deferrisoma sp.]